MFCSVILSTYNSPEWLEKVIWGYAHQTHPDFELLIADDGSREETSLRIARLRAETELRIRHFWHPDSGFRKCRILNHAIERAAGEYLIFSDGDCVPRWDFVETHARMAQPGSGLSGGCVRLPMDASRRLSRDDIASGRGLDWRWLRNSGLQGSRERMKLQTNRWLAGWLDYLTPTGATFNGHNTSAWRRDVLRANGFDERLQYGGLDRELGERLMNAGVKFRQVRHRAICLHLDHARPYVRRDAWERNKAIRMKNRQDRATWTAFGIRQDVAKSPVVEVLRGVSKADRRALETVQPLYETMFR